MREQARILVIQQDELEKSSLISSLEEAGFEVISASEAREGLNKYYDNYPDLVIIDNKLPDANGNNPVRKVRQASYLPIITLGDNPGTVDEVLDQGSDDYMITPISHSELVARVRSLLRRRWGQFRTSIQPSPDKAPAIG